MKIKNILTVLILIICTGFSQTSYEIDVHYGFGASELSFNSVPGLALSVYPFKNFGFSAGLEYSWRWQTKDYSYKGENPAAIDSEGDSIIFRYSIDKYKEEFSANILQIPIMLKYNNNLYYTAAGIKIGAYKKNNIKVNYKGLKTEGYFPEYLLTVGGETAPLSQGFGHQKDSSFSTNIKASTPIMLAFEGGIKLKLNENFNLLFGIFADYSLNKGFNRDLPPLIERVETFDGTKTTASIKANDTWKSWQPWSVGIAVKLSFMQEIEHKQSNEDLNKNTASNIPQSPTPVKNANKEHGITVNPDTITTIVADTTKIAVIPQIVPVVIPPVKGDSFEIPPLPAFLVNRKPDFIFNYPETRTSPSDSVHQILVKQIADTLKTNANLNLHCVGYSENLISESAAYEVALQRVIRIRYTLTNFYSLSEKNIFIYSQGSKNLGYRKAECFVL